MHKRKFFFIVFEGIEGSGKSYQSKKLFKNIKKKNYPVVLTREPGGTIGAERIRQVILKDYFHKNKSEKFHKYTDTLLYLAARNEHIKNTINTAYLKKKVLICDRFVDSTIAYQHYGFGINLKLIESINKYLLKKFKVTFTFLNIVSKNNLIKRINKRKILNRYDKFSYSFYEKVQKGYLKLSKRNKRKYLIINSNLDKEKNKLLILKKVNQLI